MVDVSEADDDELLKLLGDCSEPDDGAVTQEKDALTQRMRVEFGTEWEKEAGQEDRMDARLMLFHEAEKLPRRQLRDSLDAMLREARVVEQEASSPAPPPSPPPPPTTLTGDGRRKGVACLGRRVVEGGAARTVFSPGFM